jgi:hypothetical protein
MSLCVKRSRVVDRRRVDADRDWDPTFHFDADPDPYPELSFTRVRKSEVFSLILTAEASLHCSVLLVSVKDVISKFWTEITNF